MYYEDKTVPLLDAWVRLPTSWRIRYRVAGSGTWRETGVVRHLASGWGLGAYVPGTTTPAGGNDRSWAHNLWAEWVAAINGHLEGDALPPLPAQQLPSPRWWGNPEVASVPTYGWDLSITGLDGLYIYFAGDVGSEPWDRNDLHGWPALGFDTRRLGGLGPDVNPAGHPVLEWRTHTVGGEPAMRYVTTLPLMGTWLPPQTGWNAELGNDVVASQTLSPYDPAYRTTRMWGMDTRLTLDVQWVPAHAIWRERAAGMTCRAYRGARAPYAYGGTLESLWGTILRAQTFTPGQLVLDTGPVPPIKAYLGGMQVPLGIEPPLVGMDDDGTVTPVANPPSFRLLTWAGGNRLSEQLTAVQGADEQYHVVLPFYDVTPFRPGVTGSGDAPTGAPLGTMLGPNY